MKTHIFPTLYVGGASRILLCLTVFFCLGADVLLFAKDHKQAKQSQVVVQKEKNKIKTSNENVKNKKLTREEWKILKAQRALEKELREKKEQEEAVEKARKLEETRRILHSFFPDIFLPVCENLFGYGSVQNSFLNMRSTKSTKDLCRLSEKKYFFIFQNRFHHSVNRDLKSLDEYSRYTIEATDDRMTHFSSSLLFAGTLQQPSSSLKESQSKLVFSSEIFLPWSYWVSKSPYQQKGFSLALHSLYYLWQKEKEQEKRYYVKLGRFFSATQMREKQPHLTIYDTPSHGLEFFAKINSSKLYLVPFNIDSPLTEVIGENNNYYFSSSNNKDKKQGRYFRGDLIAYNASFLYQGFFAVAENKAIDFWAKLSYTRRGAFSQGSQKSDHGRLSNTVDHDYLLDGDIYFSVSVKPFRKKTKPNIESNITQEKTEQKTKEEILEIKDVIHENNEQKNQNLFDFFVLVSASHGVDYTYNFKIPLNGLSLSTGFRWKHFFNAHEFNGNTTIAWISPPAFFQSGWLKSAGYTSSQKKSYGGILLNQTCGYSPHAYFNVEQTSYMKGEHCFQLPADFYWFQSLGWNFTTQKLQTALVNTSSLSPDTQTKKITEKIPQVSWSVVLKVWLFASLTSYSQTLPKKFSVMGSELNLTLRREVKYKNTIYVSGGIFIPSTIAKTQSNHFASMLWKGGSDIFYGVQVGADFMF